MSKLEIFRSYAENEHERYIFFHSYVPSQDEVIISLEKILGYEVHIYDIFPEPNQEDFIVKEPLSIVTKSGQEMFLNVGMDVSRFDTFRILFGEKIE